MIEIRRKPHLVITMLKDDAQQASDSLNFVLGLIQEALDSDKVKADSKEMRELMRHRSNIHALYSATAERN